MLDLLTVFGPQDIDAFQPSELRKSAGTRPVSYTHLDVYKRQTVKRVTQELGGKSANIILDDADFATAVKEGAQACFRNTGQSCNAPTRMLVPKSRMAEAAATARQAAEAIQTGDPFKKGTNIGPLASKAQFEKVERLIRAGIEEGAKLIAGGPGRPEGVAKGYFAKPTVFADVRNTMTIAREEIFGPVLSIIPYEDEDDAVRIAVSYTHLDVYKRQPCMYARPLAQGCEVLGTTFPSLCACASLFGGPYG